MGMLVILVVEPDAALGEVLRDLIVSWGMRAVGATTTTEALGALDGPRPDGVILNVWPTTGDCVGLVRQVKARRDGESVPLIALADRRDDPRVQAVLAAGADDLVILPAELDDLEVRVRRLVAVGASRAAGGAIAPGGPIAGGANLPVHPLAVALSRNSTWSAYECARSRWLVARYREAREVSHQVRASARHIRAQMVEWRANRAATPA